MAIETSGSPTEGEARRGKEQRLPSDTRDIDRIIGHSAMASAEHDARRRHRNVRHLATTALVLMSLASPIAAGAGAKRYFGAERSPGASAPASPTPETLRLRDVYDPGEAVLGSDNIVAAIEQWFRRRDFAVNVRSLQVIDDLLADTEQNDSVNAQRSTLDGIAHFMHDYRLHGGIEPDAVGDEQAIAGQSRAFFNTPFIINDVRSYDAAGRLVSPQDAAYFDADITTHPQILRHGQPVSVPEFGNAPVRKSYRFIPVAEQLPDGTRQTEIDLWWETLDPLTESPVPPVPAQRLAGA